MIYDGRCCTFAFDPVAAVAQLRTCADQLFGLDRTMARFGCDAISDPHSVQTDHRE
jgi:hypothetical protein